MHVRKGSTFFKGGFEMTDTEFDGLIRQFVLGSRRPVEPNEEQAPAAQAQPQGVTREEILGALAAVVEAVRNLPAPVVHVDVKPELAVPPMTEETVIQRDDAGRMTGSTKRTRPTL